MVHLNFWEQSSYHQIITAAKTFNPNTRVYFADLARASGQPSVPRVARRIIEELNAGLTPLPFRKAGKISADGYIIL